MNFFKPGPVWNFLVLFPLIYMISFFVLLLTIVISSGFFTAEPPLFMFPAILIIFLIHILAMIVMMLNLVYGIVNVVKNKNHSDSDRIIWILILVFVGYVAVPVYHFSNLRRK